MATWYISNDLIDDGEAEGQWKGKEETFEELDEICPHIFRMLDDDGEVYYIGYCSDDSSFDPLDDFGTPNAGCTEIQYKVNGKWEAL